MIHFRCIRCQHTVQASDNAVGRKMYCPVCYLELTVPANSTIQTVHESLLYSVDPVPVDVREMAERKKFVSLRCPVCHTNIAVSREQISTEIACPECETKVLVPNSLAEKFDALTANTRNRFDKPENISSTETYELRRYSVDLSDGQNNHLSGSSSNGSRDTEMIRIYCKLCGTMMYASDDQIGTELICPDCETKNIVPSKPQKIPLPPPLPTMFEGGTTFGITENAQNSESLPTPQTPLISEPLVPVVCMLCGTRMYARENEIGGFKICPDCGRQTEIKAVTKSEMVQPVISSGEGYGVDNEESPAKRPAFRTLTDYRYVEGSLDKELYKNKPSKPSNTSKPNAVTPKPLPPPMLYDPDLPFNPSTDKPPVIPLAKPSAADHFNTNSPISNDERLVLKKAGYNIENRSIQKAERSLLPKHPFWTRFFVPFSNFKLWLLTMTVSCCCMAGFIFCPMLSGRWLVVGIVLGMIIALLGLNLLTNTCYSLFLWTASGNDLPEKDDWQEYQFFISDLFTMWLFFLTMIAATPGYLLVLFFSAPTDILQQDIIQQQITDNIPLYYILLTLISVILFFPVLFLSCMESDSYFAILAEGTCRSLLRSTKIWLRFYGISLLLAILFCVIIGAISAMVRDRIFAGFAAAVPAAAIFLLLYARLLGRLGWALEEQGRLDDSDY